MTKNKLLKKNTLQSWCLSLIKFVDHHFGEIDQRTAKGKTESGQVYTKLYRVEKDKQTINGQRLRAILEINGQVEDIEKWTDKKDKKLRMQNWKLEIWKRIKVWCLLIFYKRMSIFTSNKYFWDSGIFLRNTYTLPELLNLSILLSLLLLLLILLSLLILLCIILIDNFRQITNLKKFSFNYVFLS